MNALPGTRWDQLVHDCLAYCQELQNNRQLLDSNALQSVQSATLVRVRGGKIMITDGPVAETKEQLAGYFLLEAKDLEQAIQLMSRLPQLRYGSLEIRPVRELLEPNGCPKTTPFVKHREPCNTQTELNPSEINPRRNRP